MSNASCLGQVPGGDGRLDRGGEWQRLLRWEMESEMPWRLSWRPPDHAHLFMKADMWDEPQVSGMCGMLPSLLLATGSYAGWP